MHSDKLRELRAALVDAGFLTLHQQARSLGLSRSTAWKVLKERQWPVGDPHQANVCITATPTNAAKIIHEHEGKKSAGAYGPARNDCVYFVL